MFHNQILAEGGVAESRISQLFLYVYHDESMNPGDVISVVESFLGPKPYAFETGHARVDRSKTHQP